MRGFTMIEVVVAIAIMLAITAGAFTAIQASPDGAFVQSELADMQQRSRVAVDAIMRDAVNATEVRPRRWGGPSEDPPGVFRGDTIALTADGNTTTYWLKVAPSTDTYQLTQWSGGTSNDVPVVEHVVALQFDYFGDGDVPLLDPDLSGLRSIGVTLRIEAAAAALRGPAGPQFSRAGSSHTARRWAPDLQVHFRVSPRNACLDR